MSITITRRFEVPTAHRLHNHEGSCRHIHGHNHICEVTLSSEELDYLGRVVDFSKVKQIIGRWLNDNWDHCMLVNEADSDIIGLAVATDVVEKVMKAPPVELFKKLYVFKGNPTAELMARELFIVTQGLLVKENLPTKVVKVRIWETSSCYADYSPDDDFSEHDDGSGLTQEVE